MPKLIPSKVKSRTTGLSIRNKWVRVPSVGPFRDLLIGRQADSESANVGSNPAPGTNIPSLSAFAARGTSGGNPDGPRAPGGRPCPVRADHHAPRMGGRRSLHPPRRTTPSGLQTLGLCPGDPDACRRIAFIRPRCQRLHASLKRRRNPFNSGGADQILQGRGIWGPHQAHNLGLVGSNPIPATRARRPMAGLLPCKQEIGVQLSSGPPIFSGALPSGIVNWSVKPVPIRLRGPIPHAPTTATHSVSVRRAAFEAASCTFDSCRGNQKYLGV